MKLTILVDNHTRTGEYYLGEPGLCYYIEDEEERFLFDTGFSGIFADNARKLGIDLSTLDTLVFSHGHNDHTGGLPRFLELNRQPSLKIIAHPDAFRPKTHFDGRPCGCPISEEDLANRAALVLTKEPYKVTEHITFMGEIGHYHDFETHPALGRMDHEEDFMKDDSALVYQTDQGICIITGCSHSGICNIIEEAKQITKDDRILGVIGGFHLFKADDRAEQTLSYFKDNGIEILYPCHCTSFQVRAFFHTHYPVKFELGVGNVIEW